MPLHVEYETISQKIRWGNIFADTYAKLPVENESGEEWKIIIAHTGYNFVEKRTEESHQTAYINLLSSIRGAMNGKLLRTIWELEYNLYRNELGKVKNVEDIPKKNGERMLSKVIEILPGDIIYLRIIIAERAQKALEKYYMETGEKFREEWKIIKASFYGQWGCNEWVCYQIREMQS